MNLTPREKEVAGLVARGMTNAEIAERLVTSEQTIKGHVTNILSKTFTRNRVELAVWYVLRDGKGEAV